MDTGGPASATYQSSTVDEVLLKDVTSILQKTQLNLVYIQQKSGSVNDPEISLTGIDDSPLWAGVRPRTSTSECAHMTLAGDSPGFDEYSKRIRLASLVLALYREFRAWVCKFGAESHNHVVRKPTEILNDVASSQAVLVVLTWLSKVQLQKLGSSQHVSHTKRGIYMRLCEQLAKYFIAGGDMSGLKDWLSATKGQIDAYKHEMKNSKAEFRPLHETPENEATSIKAVMPLDWFVYHKCFDQLLWPYLCAEISQLNSTPSNIAHIPLDILLQNQALVAFLVQLLRSWSLMHILEKACSSGFNPCDEVALQIPGCIRDVLSTLAQRLAVMGVYHKECVDCVKSMAHQVVGSRHEFMQVVPNAELLGGLLNVLQQKLLMERAANIPMGAMFASANEMSPSLPSNSPNVPCPTPTQAAPPISLPPPIMANEAETRVNPAKEASTTNPNGQSLNQPGDSERIQPDAPSVPIQDIEPNFSPAVDTTRDAALDSIIAKALDCLNSYNKPSSDTPSARTTPSVDMATASSSCSSSSSIGLHSSQPSCSYRGNTQPLIVNSNNQAECNGIPHPPQAPPSSVRQDQSTLNSAMASLQSYVQGRPDTQGQSFANGSHLGSSSPGWPPSINQMIPQPHPNFPFEQCMMAAQRNIALEGGQNNPQEPSGSHVAHQPPELPTLYANSHEPGPPYANGPAMNAGVVGAVRYPQQPNPAFRIAQEEAAWFSNAMQQGFGGSMFNGGMPRNSRPVSPVQCMAAPPYPNELVAMRPAHGVLWGPRPPSMFESSPLQQSFNPRLRSPQQQTIDMRLNDVPGAYPSVPHSQMSPSFNSSQAPMFNSSSSQPRASVRASGPNPSQGFPDAMYTARQTRPWLRPRGPANQIPQQQQQLSQQQLSPRATVTRATGPRQQASLSQQQQQHQHPAGHRGMPPPYSSLVHHRAPATVTRRSRSASATSSVSMNSSRPHRQQRSGHFDSELPAPIPLNLPAPDMTIQPIVIAPQEDSAPAQNSTLQRTQQVIVKPEPSKRRRVMSDTTINIDIDLISSPQDTIILDDDTEPCAHMETDVRAPVTCGTVTRATVSAITSIQDTQRSRSSQLTASQPTIINAAIADHRVQPVRVKQPPASHKETGARTPVVEVDSPVPCQIRQVSADTPPADARSQKDSKMAVVSATMSVEKTPSRSGGTVKCRSSPPPTPSQELGVVERREGDRENGDGRLHPALNGTGLPQDVMPQADVVTGLDKIQSRGVDVMRDVHSQLDVAQRDIPQQGEEARQRDATQGDTIQHSIPPRSEDVKRDIAQQREVGLQRNATQGDTIQRSIPPRSEDVKRDIAQQREIGCHRDATQGDTIQRSIPPRSEEVKRDVRIQRSVVLLRDAPQSDMEQRELPERDVPQSAISHQRDLPERDVPQSAVSHQRDLPERDVPQSAISHQRELPSQCDTAQSCDQTNQRGAQVRPNQIVQDKQQLKEATQISCKAAIVNKPDQGDTQKGPGSISLNQQTPPAASSPELTIVDVKDQSYMRKNLTSTAPNPEVAVEKHKCVDTVRLASNLASVSSTLAAAAAIRNQINPEYILMDEVYLADALFDDGDVKDLLDWDTSDGESMVSGLGQRRRRASSIASSTMPMDAVNPTTEVTPHSKTEPCKSTETTASSRVSGQDHDVQIITPEANHSGSRDRNLNKKSASLSPRNHLRGSGDRRLSQNSTSPVRTYERDAGRPRRTVCYGDENQTGRSNLDDGYLSDEEHIVLRVRKKDFVNIDLDTDFEVVSPNFSPRSRWLPRLPLSPGRASAYSDDNGSLPDLCSSPESQPPGGCINIEIPPSARSPRQRRRSHYSPGSSHQALSPRSLPATRGGVGEQETEAIQSHDHRQSMQPPEVVRVKEQSAPSQNRTINNSSPDVLITHDNLDDDVIIIGES